jgi:hypothetical protein
VLALAGVNDNLAGAPAATLRAAVAVVNPVADAVMVALPVLTAMNVEEAIPLTADIVEEGLKDPETPVTENVMALVAVDTVLPDAS